MLIGKDAPVARRQLTATRQFPGRRDGKCLSCPAVTPIYDFGILCCHFLLEHQMTTIKHSKGKLQTASCHTALSVARQKGGPNMLPEKQCLHPRGLCTCLPHWHQSEHTLAVVIGAAIAADGTVAGVASLRCKKDIPAWCSLLLGGASEASSLANFRIQNASRTLKPQE